MFTKSSFVSDIVPEIFQKGKIEIQEAIFQEFNQFLETLGLDVAFTTFYKQPQKQIIRGNSSDNGNDIAVYLKTTENFQKHGFTNGHNWGGDYEHTEAIKDKWKELARKFDYDISYYDFIAHVFVYDFEKIYLYRLIMSSKAEAERFVKKKTRKARPEHIFGSSSPPCFRIIYKNGKIYDLAKQHGYFEAIAENINLILAKNDFLNMYKRGRVTVEYYHAEMNVSMHGMSRED